MKQPAYPPNVAVLFGAILEQKQPSPDFVERGLLLRFLSKLKPTPLANQYRFLVSFRKLE